MIQNLIEQYIQDPIKFLKKYGQEQKILEELIQYAKDQYYNGDEIMTDEQYDKLIDYMKLINPENKINNEIGTKLKHDINKVKIPYHMGSMNKLKGDDLNGINKWKKKYDDEYYIYSDKLDGISGLLIIKDNIKKLYKRGDKNISADISHLIEYIPSINNIKTDKNIVFRGELVISKNNFKKYENKMKNARNMVNGITINKTINEKILKDIDFVIYEIVDPFKNFEKQFKKLNDMDDIISVYNKKIKNKNINPEYLIDILKKRKNKSEYQIDGIIITSIQDVDRNKSGNPEYSFAFKDTSLNESAITEVKNVDWNVSKDRLLKPRLKLKPIYLNGAEINYVTANNAKYIYDNNIGKGTILEIIRSGDVIPYIKQILNPSKEPQMPEDIKWQWSKTKVDIIQDEYENDEELNKKQLLNYCEKMKIKYVSEKMIDKLYDIGIETIDDLYKYDQQDLQQLKEYEGIGDKMIQKVYDNIQESKKNMTLDKFIYSSNKLGSGFGQKKIDKILQNYPNIIYEEDDDKIINDIINLEGFNKKTAKKFVDGLDDLIQLMNNIPFDIPSNIPQKIKQKTDNKKNNKLQNMEIVFSGFRNKNWVEQIENNNGKVSESISKKTDILVIKEQKQTSKIEKAQKLNIKIIEKDIFEKQYIQNI